MSESPGDGQPETSGPSQSSNPPRSNSGSPHSSSKNNSGQPRANGQSGSRNQSGSGRGASRGSDPVADFQRWLMKAGARSMANQVADQVEADHRRRSAGQRRRVGYGHERAAAHRAAGVPVVPGLPGGPRRPHGQRRESRREPGQRGRGAGVRGPGCLLRLRAGHEDPRSKPFDRTVRGSAAERCVRSRGNSRGHRSVTLAIGVDVGGTKVAAGVVDEDGRIIAKLKRSTPAASPARTEQAIADAVTELLGRHQAPQSGHGHRDRRGRVRRQCPGDHAVRAEPRLA